jgi:hypothetical protein
LELARSQQPRCERNRPQINNQRATRRDINAANDKWGDVAPFSGASATEESYVIASRQAPEAIGASLSDTVAILEWFGVERLKIKKIFGITVWRTRIIHLLFFAWQTPVLASSRRLEKRLHWLR